MADLTAVLPVVLGAIALGTLILGQLKAAHPTPAPVRAKPPRR